MSGKLISKSGKEFDVREPQVSNAEALLGYINELVEEDTFILVNEVQTLEEEVKFVERALGEIEKGERVHLLVWDGKFLVGNAQVTRGKYRQKHVGTFGISVSRDYRGEGIGYQLAELVIKEAAEKLGVTVLELEYLEINEVAKRMYEKLGFVEWGRFPEGIEYKGQLMAKVYMSREIPR